MEYHFQFFGPLKNEYVDWPADSVSVYSWCGYIGCFESLDKAVEAVKTDRAEQLEWEARQKAREARK